MGRAFKSIPSLPQPHDLSLDLFRVIADPIHYVILDSTFLDDFQADPQWISSRLGASITEVKLAIERLFSLGLMEKKKGRWVKTQSHVTTADKHLTSSALRKHQRVVIERALHALDNEPIERRSSNSLTLSANPRKLPQAKRLIEKFMTEMAQLLNDGPQTDVYQISLALFPITKISHSGGSQ